MAFDRPFFPHQSQSYKHSAVSCPKQSILRSNSTFAGRKRSRDEAAPNLDEPEKTVPTPSVEEPEDEWEYGPGMMLIKKTGYVVDATSQSGTWVDEKTAEEHAQKTEAAILAQEQLAQERPSLRSNKSQRLDMTNTTLSAVEETKSSSPGRDKSPEAPAQPVIDDFTLHLGIGWGRISEDEHIKAAARGWNRFIENHYPITNAQIRLESKGLESYLVEAAEGFFLFAENLRQGRLVSRDAQRALQNLKSSPPVFDGPETMIAAETSQQDDTPIGPTATNPTTMDMDMS